MNKLKFSLLTLSIVLASQQVWALAPQYKANDIPVLSAEPQHKTAEQRITQLFERSHYKRFNLNDAMSEKIFNAYIDMLDFNHNVLMQSEIDMLRSVWGKTLDDELKSGSTQAAYRIYTQLSRARYDRYVYALSLLDQPFDFTKDDKIEIDRSEAPWPTSQAELNRLWQLRVKNDALNLKLSGKSDKEIKDKLFKRYNMAIHRLIQAKSEDVFQTFMLSFTHELDPHTSYLSPRAAKDFQQNMNLSLDGIGAVLQMDDDYTVIRSLIPGGPAEKSKRLKKGDRIIGVGQEKGEIVDVMGWRLDDIVEKIKGPKGTTVRLEILPKGENSSSHVITIKRDSVRLEDSAVKEKIITENGKKIAVLTVPSFYSGLTKDTYKLLQKINEDDAIVGIVVDLRNNGGGALQEADGMVGLFINEGPVVQVRDSLNRVSIDMDPVKGTEYHGPMTVLINQNSASASEIFAAAMQDYGRALILGEHSFGKGTVQQYRGISRVYDLFEKPMGNVTYTIQKFYRINGGSTQNKGVTPDILYPSAVSPEDTGESTMDNALPWDKIEPAPYKKLYDFSKVIPVLQKKHLARITSDPDYGYIFENIKRYKKRQSEKMLSLNFAKRKAEKEAADKRSLARINAYQKEQGKALIKNLDDIPDDYEYPDPELKETAKITIDLASYYP